MRKTVKNAEFVFLEPPIVVEKADMPWNQGSLDEFGSNATTETEMQTPETTPRAWWLSAADRTVYKRELGVDLRGVSRVKLVIVSMRLGGSLLSLTSSFEADIPLEAEKLGQS